VLSHERRRPSTQGQGPVELDWYATQRPARTGTSPTPAPASVQRAASPALAILGREGRSNSLPLQNGYSASQPNLVTPMGTSVPVAAELDGGGMSKIRKAVVASQAAREMMRGVGPGQSSGSGIGIGVAELDGRETGYRAYQGRPT
jgi:hypothetical protein